MGGGGGTVSESIVGTCPSPCSAVPDLDAPVSCKGGRRHSGTELGTWTGWTVLLD